MAVDVEKIIQSIAHGDQESVLKQLDLYNTQFAQCFFFNLEEKERKKQRQLEEFRRNKVRDYVPDSDSDVGSGDDDDEDPDLVLRRRLAEALLRFVRTRLQPSVLSVSLRTLRILSRDRQALAPFITNSAILTLTRLGGIKAPPVSQSDHAEEKTEEEEEKVDDVDSNPVNNTDLHVQFTDAAGPCVSPASSHTPHCMSNITEMERTDAIHGVLARGKRDVREEDDEGTSEWCDDGEVWRKEAMKTLCNVIYNSQRAQERASALSLLSGLSEKLKDGLHSVSPPSGQFYELRLLFLLTALRPELRRQLQQERGVSMLTAALELCLEVQWADMYEVMAWDSESPPVRKEASQRALEILKVLFNVTYSSHTQQPDEEDAALYRRLAAVLRHCLLLRCQGEELTEELQGQTVNVLSALPLQCLDVLLSARLSEGSRESGGVNMDCVHSLLLFMEKRLDRGHKLKERLTPVLNLLTESCRAHTETRHYLRQQILPPLRDVALRPEQGDTIRNKLVRLMTHVDTELKHCAAELLFVLCKENVGRFVKYTGYGNAAGLLAARGLLSGRSAASQHQYSSDSDSDTEEYRQARDRINLVTGRVEEPQPDPMEGMSEEEKEAEAVRLVSMFNRLSRDKIIQPMLVMPDGRLAPLCGRMRNSTLEEEEEEEEEEEADYEEEVD
ncbi:chaperone Ric-8A [Clarias gariepinus]|uniref:synembryn-A n=1 Tax=Clarias gariepinus TaxID=13013 RepID=UPI00234D00A1|nr:synembryn-A [Clarias gariepinus]XP_053370874.1 synembryn-A [Clarias gariepinus]